MINFQYHQLDGTIVNANILVLVDEYCGNARQPQMLVIGPCHGSTPRILPLVIIIFPGTYPKFATFKVFILTKIEILLIWNCDSV